MFTHSSEDDGGRKKKIKKNLKYVWDNDEEIPNIWQVPGKYFEKYLLEIKRLQDLEKHFPKKDIL